jgi:hypothetical protein
MPGQTFRAPEPVAPMHVGPIHSSVAGRTDHLPMHVPSGSYVLPADVVSAHGEGSTMAAFKVLRRMFGGTPYGGGSKGPYGQGSGPYGEHLAKGGKTDDNSKGVAIVAAGGEYVLSPDQVRDAGGGDIDRGHKVLDAYVLHVRKELIDTLRKLPGPAKS